MAHIEQVHRKGREREGKQAGASGSAYNVVLAARGSVWGGV